MKGRPERYTFQLFRQKKSPHSKRITNVRQIRFWKFLQKSWLQNLNRSRVPKEKVARLDENETNLK